MSFLKILINPVQSRQAAMRQIMSILVKHHSEKSYIFVKFEICSFTLHSLQGIRNKACTLNNYFCVWMCCVSDQQYKIIRVSQTAQGKVLRSEEVMSCSLSFQLYILCIADA